MRTFYTLFKSKNALKISLLAAIGWLGTSGLQAQIIGDFTIDQNSPASATNYQDFQSVIDDLQGMSRTDGGTYQNHYKDGDDDSAALGITGHATFTVVSGSGPYAWTSTDQLVIPQITGMSSTATVTFKGNMERINYAGNNSERSAILFDGGDWFRLDSIELYNNKSSDRAWGIQFKNQSDNNIIENSTIRIPNARSTSTSTTLMSACIVFSEEDGVLNTSEWGVSSQGDNGNDNIIRNNIIGGAETAAGAGVTYAIFVCGDGIADGAANTLIENNYINNFYYRGIYYGFADDIIVRGNEVTNDAVTTQGTWGAGMIVEDNNGNTGNITSTIEQNYLHQNYGTNTGAQIREYFGIVIQNAPDQGVVNVRNNVITDLISTSGPVGGINYSGFSPSTTNVNIYHNTISFDDRNMTSSPRIEGIQWEGQGTVNGRVRNNIISITSNQASTNFHYGYFDRGWNAATYSDNVVFVNRNVTGTPDARDFYGSVANTNYADLAAWQAQGRGNNSSEENPNFADWATGDLTPLSFVINNTGANLGITNDFFDSMRSTTPDPGAIEVSIDAEVSAFPWTDLLVCGGFENDVTITVRNNNSFDIKDVPVFFSVNAVRVDEVVTATIAAGGTTNYTFSRTAQFNDPGLNVLSAGIGVSDDNPSNDVISYNVTVTTSPTGSMLTNNNPDPRPLNGAIHNLAGFDITVPGVALDYTFSAPAPNNSSAYGAYGTDWTAVSTLVTKAGGVITTGNVDAPGTIDFSVTVDPDIAMTDSLLTLMVTFTDVNSNCDTTYQKDILVAPRGVLDFSFPPTICVDELVVFDNLSTVSTGFLENTWRVTDPSNNVTFAEGTNPALSFDAPGNWTVELISETNPYFFRDSILKTVTVTPIPTVDFTRVNACEGEQIVLTNQTTPANANYTWDFGDGSPTVNTLNASKTYTPGGYAVTLTAEQNGCAASTTKNVYQFARPVANAAVLNGLCDNEEFTFQNNSTISVGNTGYLWDFDEPNSVSTAASPTYDFQTPGMKEVRLRAVSEFGCEDSLDMPLVVNVLEAPMATFTIDQTCSRTPSTFTNNSTTPANATNTNTWTIEGQTDVDNNPTKTHNWSTTGQQTVTLMVESDNNCTDILVQEVAVLIQPEADFILSDVCEGEELKLTNLSQWPEGEISYEWTMPAATPSFSTDGSPEITITGLPGGGQNFVLKATIAGGCSDEKVIPVDIKPLPETCDFDITADFANGLNNFDLTPTGGALAGTNYTWIYSFGGQDQTVASGKEDVQFPDGIGTVSVRMVADRDGCNCTSTKAVQLSSTKLVTGGEFRVYPNPTAGKLNIEVTDNNETLSIGIYNSIGVEVARVHNNNVKNGNFDVDLSDLAAGLYIVRVKTGSEVTTKRITLTK